MSGHPSLQCLLGGMALALPELQKDSDEICRPDAATILFVVNPANFLYCNCYSSLLPLFGPVCWSLAASNLRKFWFRNVMQACFLDGKVYVLGGMHPY